MVAALESFANTLTWLCIFGPIIFVGLLMVLDPSSFRSLLHDFAECIRRLEQQFQTRWQRPLFLPISATPAPKTDVRADAVMRLMGLVTIAVSLRGLWEALR